METIRLRTTDDIDVDLTLINGVLRIELKSWSLMMLEYWPIEWVTLSSCKLRPSLDIEKRTLFLSLLALAVIFGLGGGSVLIDAPANWSNIPFLIYFLVLYTATLSTLLIALVKLYRRWKTARWAVVLELSGRNTAHVWHTFWALPDSMQREWEFLLLLHALRSRKKDPSCLGSFFPYRYGYVPRFAAFGQIPSGAFYWMLIGAAFGGGLLTLLAIRVLGVASILLAGIGMSLGAMGVLAYYVYRYVLKGIEWRKRSTSLRRAIGALRTFEPEMALDILQPELDRQPTAAGFGLAIDAALMQGDLQLALGLCARLSDIDPGAGSEKLEIIQAYRPLFMRMGTPYRRPDSIGDDNNMDDDFDLDEDPNQLALFPEEP